MCVYVILFSLQTDSLDSFALSKKIQEVYKHEHGKNLAIVCPVEGQACVAKQEDENWYRAQIIGEVSIFSLRCQVAKSDMVLDQSHTGYEQ